MRRYQVYWIAEEFAQHFYGRERMFHQLFNEMESSTGELLTIITNQVEYITRPIPYLPTRRFIQNELLSVKGSGWDEDRAMIQQESSGVSLELKERALTIHAWGLDESEYIFFEILRRHMGYLLAVDIQNERFGWLKPIKQRKFIY
ncbi:hypothetical protein RKD55_002320 [Rossellomorea marisflavi]